MHYVDTWMTVSEDDIANAIKGLLHHEGKLVEGAAACAVAACRNLADQLRGKKVVVVCCGGNVALQALQHVLLHGSVD
jgi:threonine dehydratase